MLRNLGSSPLDRATKLGYGVVLLGTFPLLVRPFHSLLQPWVSSCDPPGVQGKDRGTPTALQQQLITTGLLGGHPMLSHCGLCADAGRVRGAGSWCTACRLRRSVSLSGRACCHHCERWHMLYPPRRVSQAACTTSMWPPVHSSPSCMSVRRCLPGRSGGGAKRGVCAGADRGDCGRPDHGHPAGRQLPGSCQPCSHTGPPRPGPDSWCVGTSCRIV